MNLVRSLRILVVEVSWVGLVPRMYSRRTCVMYAVGFTILARCSKTWLYNLLYQFTKISCCFLHAINIRMSFVLSDGKRRLLKPWYHDDPSI